MIRIILLMLIATSAHAKEYMLQFKWVTPTTRVMGQALPIKEISGYKIWEVDCAKPHSTGIELDMKVPSKQTTYWWASDKPKSCAVMTVMTTDGKESVLSPVFVAFDFRTPQPPMCTLK